MSVERATRALVLGVVDTRDTDRVVTLLTEGFGRVSAWAAGARRSRRRFAGALEPFTLLDVRLREGRGELWFLESCAIVEPHAGIRDDLGRIAHAGHAAELCRELSREHEPSRELFAALAVYLAGLAAGPARPEDLLSFELAALACAGLEPRLDACAICGGAPGGAFDAAHGGMLCERCLRAAHPGVVRVDPPVHEALRALQVVGPRGGASVPASGVRAAARAVVRRFTRHALGRSPRTLEVLEQLGIEG